VTTIAYSRIHDQLAADTLCNSGGTRTYVSKIAQIHNARFGVAGNLRDFYRVQDFILGGMQGKPPKMPGSEALIVVDDKTFWCNEERYLAEITDDYAAIGTGEMVAMAFMRDGCTPVQAVEKAATVDIYTGGSVECL